MSFQFQPNKTNTPTMPPFSTPTTDQGLKMGFQTQANKTNTQTMPSFSTPATGQAQNPSGVSFGLSLASGDAKTTGTNISSLSSTPMGNAQKPTGFSIQSTPSNIGNTSSTPSLGGGVGLTSTQASTAVSSSAATPGLSLYSSQSSGAIKLGAQSTNTTTSGTATTVVSSATQPAGKLTSATTLVTPAAANSSSASTIEITPSNMNHIQLEELINKWTLELEEQDKMFINQATQINAWDRLLISNSEKIVNLNNSVETVKLQQQQLIYELDFILAQQRELEESLVPLENSLASTPANIDPQREHMYHKAESLDTQLKQMSEDLKEIIDHLNESNKTKDNNDPIIQIGKILDDQMNTLQWVDEQILQIQNKLSEVSKMHDVHRRENERTFRSTYD